MRYELLSKLYYQDRDRYEKTYLERVNGEYTVRLNFEVADWPAFFVQTPEIYSMVTNILRMNQAVSNLCQGLPGAAIDQFSRRCLIDEIVLTNNIEGVRSTRKEISDILDELGYDSRYIIKSKLSDSGVIVISLKNTKQPFKLSICRIINYFAVVVLLIYSIVILIALILAHYHSLAYIV